MNGAVDILGEEKNVVTVFLTCISCGKVEEIHVFRDRDRFRKVFWNCLDCQAGVSMPRRMGDNVTRFLP